MINQFIKAGTSIGTLYFRASTRLYSYKDGIGLLVTKSKPEHGKKLRVELVHAGMSINNFEVEVSEVSEVRLNCKRSAIEVPPEHGGFKFGKKYFRTILVPTSEVPVFEVPFEAQPEVFEVLVGLA